MPEHSFHPDRYLRELRASKLAGPADLARITGVPETSTADPGRPRGADASPPSDYADSPPFRHDLETTFEARRE